MFTTRTGCSKLDAPFTVPGIPDFRNTNRIEHDCSGPSSALRPYPKAHDCSTVLAAPHDRFRLDSIECFENLEYSKQ